MKMVGNKNMTQGEGDNSIIDGGVADDIKNSYFHRITFE